MNLLRPKQRVHTLSLVLALAVAASSAPAQVTITQSSPSGFYAAGDTPVFTVSAEENAAIVNVTYRFRVHGATNGPNAGAPAPLDLSKGPVELKTTAAEPGTTMLEVNWRKPDGKDAKAYLGAAFDYTKIEPTTPPPDDFDQFWQDQLKLLAAVPMNAAIEPVALAPATRPSDANPDKIEYAKVTLDNIDGSKIYGQIARPKPTEGKKYPAVLQVQYAGVYGLGRGNVTDRATNGWIALNIMPHDVPFDLKPEEYKKLGETTLKNYTQIGRTSRETSYFRRMFLSCYRGVDFLTQQPDWNGEVLLVTGDSQGGMQAIVAASLHPQVTAVVCNVPAGSDTLQGNKGRLIGWPGWLWNLPEDKNEREKIFETSRYFDPVNFAPKVKVPTLVGMGMVDTVSTPSGVFALYNKLAGPKRLIAVPQADHQGAKGAFDGVRKVMWAWSVALRDQTPLPMGDQ